MKRKFSQTKPKDPSPIRISFPRSSDNQFNAAKVDEPKTSEYAFFKKLKTDQAGHRHSQSHGLPHEQKIRSKTTPRSSEYRNVERSGAIKDLRLPVQELTCVDRGLCLSPVELKRASTTFGDMCSTSMEEHRNTLRNAGTHKEHEDLFSAKRQRLLQWVTDVSFPEIKELCSKGYDFVSVLLNRLFPESNEENVSFKIPMRGQAERNTESKLLISPYSNIQSKKDCHTSTRNFVKVGYDSYLESGIPSCWLDRGITSSNTPYSPTFHTQSIILDYNFREPSFDLGKRKSNSWIENDSSFNFLSENCGSLPSCHLREQDDFHGPNSSLLAGEHHPLLLGWDSQSMTNDTTSAVISHNAELIAYPTSVIPWVNNHDHSLDDGYGALDASGLSVSSIICKHPAKFCPLPPSPSTSYCKHDFRMHFTEDDEDMAADLSHYPSALSHTRKYLCPTGDLNHDIEYKGSSAALLSPGNHGWFSRKMSRASHHDSGTEALLTSELDYYLERKCLLINESSSNHYASIDHDPQFPQNEDMLFSHNIAKDKIEDWLELDGNLGHSGILNYISKDMINVRDRSSFYFQMSLELQKACPLLLDKSSWDEIEGEKCHDDSEVKCI